MGDRTELAARTIYGGHPKSNRFTSAAWNIHALKKEPEEKCYFFQEVLDISELNCTETLEEGVNSFNV